MAASHEKPRIGVDVEEAWSRFKDRLRAFVLRRVGSTADAEDVVQDVLVRLLEHRERIESDRLAPWIFTTARNAVIDRRRRTRRDLPRSSEEDATLAATGEQDRGLEELTTCVGPLLAMLSTEDRAVLERVELGGESQAELAEAAGAPASTIKSRVQRARQRLREHFERCCAIELDARGKPRDFSWRGSPDYPKCGGCDCGSTEN